MTEQELEHKMKQILDDYAPILNITPIENLPTPRKRSKRKNPKPLKKTVSQKSQDELEPIEESPLKNKNQSVENKSLPQDTNDQDSTS